MKAHTLFVACVALAFSMSTNAQKSNAEYLEDLKAAGYPDLRALSFEDTKKKHSLTGLYKSETDKDPLLAFAEISLTRTGADISFSTNRPCVLTEKDGRLPQRVIMISGQKVEAYYVCSANPTRAGTSEVFLIKSPAGKDFAKNEFTKFRYVFVHLHDLPIPFATEGFSRVFAESGGKAL